MAETDRCEVSELIVLYHAISSCVITMPHAVIPYLLQGERDDSLMGKTVRIQAGQWKGYLGTVSHTTATHVQVELHSRLKKVMVVKERVHVIGDKFGATDNGDDSTGISGVSTPAFVGGMTPMHGGATPMHGGATPMHGGATPMHDGYGCESLYTFLVNLYSSKRHALSNLL